MRAVYPPRCPRTASVFATVLAPTLSTLRAEDSQRVLRACGVERAQSARADVRTAPPRSSPLQSPAGWRRVCACARQCCGRGCRGRCARSFCGRRQLRSQRRSLPGRGSACRPPPSPAPRRGAWYAKEEAEARRYACIISAGRSIAETDERRNAANQHQASDAPATVLPATPPVPPAPTARRACHLRRSPSPHRCRAPPRS